MQATRSLGKAAGETVALIDERFDGYRVALVKRLAALIQTQDAAGGQSARRAQVEREIITITDLIGNSEKEPSV